METPKTFEDARKMLALMIRGVADMLVDTSKSKDREMRMDDALRRATEMASRELQAILYEEQKRLDWLGEVEGQSHRWSEDLFKIADGTELQKD